MKHYILPKQYCIQLIAIFISVISFQCTKEKQEDPFCTVQRTHHQTFEKIASTVIFSSKYNHYGVSIPFINANLEESQIIGYTCSLPKEFQNVGMEVIVSGTFKKFNQEENIEPEIVGQEVYYLEITDAFKRP